eukprot:TRINITY_DN2933_c5_g2_i1.p1 TRINITY_DN2933_c5_g2~~TRINITY_DN2933_c5_g2_i1.p1  ORF type:complete len:814 (+),score=254.37 TRINITY_DN2933_c5_g2_i1:199-2640(+)
MSESETPRKQILERLKAVHAANRIKLSQYANQHSPSPSTISTNLSLDFTPKTVLSTTPLTSAVVESPEQDSFYQRLMDARKEASNSPFLNDDANSLKITEMYHSYEEDEDEDSNDFEDKQKIDHENKEIEVSKNEFSRDMNQEEMSLPDSQNTMTTTQTIAFRKPIPTKLPLNLMTVKEEKKEEFLQPLNPHFHEMSSKYRIFSNSSINNVPNVNMYMYDSILNKVRDEIPMNLFKDSVERKISTSVADITPLLFAQQQKVTHIVNRDKIDELVKLFDSRKEQAHINALKYEERRFARNFIQKIGKIFYGSVINRILSQKIEKMSKIQTMPTFVENTQLNLHLVRQEQSEKILQPNKFEETMEPSLNDPKAYNWEEMIEAELRRTNESQMNAITTPEPIYKSSNLSKDPQSSSNAIVIQRWSRGLIIRLILNMNQSISLKREIVELSQMIEETEKMDNQESFLKTLFSQLRQRSNDLFKLVNAFGNKEISVEKLINNTPTGRDDVQKVDEVKIKEDKHLDKHSADTNNNIKSDEIDQAEIERKRQKVLERKKAQAEAKAKREKLQQDKLDAARKDKAKLHAAMSKKDDSSKPWQIDNTDNEDDVEEEEEEEETSFDSDFETNNSKQPQKRHQRMKEKEKKSKEEKPRKSRVKIINKPMDLSHVKSQVDHRHAATPDIGQQNKKGKPDKKPIRKSRLSNPKTPEEVSTPSNDKNLVEEEDVTSMKRILETIAIAFQLPIQKKELSIDAVTQNLLKAKHLGPSEQIFHRDSTSIIPQLEVNSDFFSFDESETIDFSPTLLGINVMDSDLKFEYIH